jgi:serralysin
MIIGRARGSPVAGLNSTQDQEVTFISGVTPQGAIAAQSFWTWNDDLPATYSPSLSYEAKWGSDRAGTAGTLSVAFEFASNWTATEQAAFTAAMHLWSAEANITFNIIPQAQGADVLISRGVDHKAQGGINRLDTGDIGSTHLGVAIDGSLSIDTSQAGWGPIGSGFGVAGGNPWNTVLHELGHVIGLGHGGAYNDGTTSSSPQYTSYDNTAYSLMSYNDAPDLGSNFVWGSSGGYLRTPVTPMMLDIAAADRIYGLPVGGPLSGGQTFGFHTNISGDIAQFFDFTVNTRPVVTLFDTGTGNVLDLSGYTVGSTVDLHDGAFSSVSGLQNNLAIAIGTRIDTAIGGSAGDNLTANDNGDVLMGGAGADQLHGGAGNDHIYGNMASTAQGSTDGADIIDAGDGSNYVNGNAGNDVITAGWGTNRLYGGGGDDQIHVTGGGVSHLNGNLGDDLLQVDGGVNDIHGGQGNDRIIPTAGENHSFGEAGNDVIWGGSGFDVMTGGPGSDLFVLSGPTNSNLATWDEITDYESGADKLHMDVVGSGLPEVIHAASVFADEASAAAYAQAAFSGAGSSEAAALQVGADTYLFYTAASVGSPVDAVVKLDGINAATISQSDFVTGTNHL